MSHPVPPADAVATALRAFADTMIPGDGDFPAASEAGADALMADRLAAQGGPDEPAALAAALDRLAGGVFATFDAGSRAAAVAALQDAEPARFAWTRTVLYFSYYQQPAVVEAIRRMGVVYNDTPLPHGYRMLPFDSAPEGTAPLLGNRGTYRRTDGISRLDLGHLAAVLQAELGR
jgi:hypothetical protein